MTWKDLTEEDLERMKRLELGRSLTMSEILWAVKDPEWQALRVSLKGLRTAVKLQELEAWLWQHQDRRHAIQVDNYLNALRRGGQLPPKEVK